MCCTTSPGTDRSCGNAASRFDSASGPPVEQPITKARNGRTRAARGASLAAGAPLGAEPDAEPDAAPTPGAPSLVVARPAWRGSTPAADRRCGTRALILGT